MGENSFRRYTNLAATIRLLSTKRISLLNPAAWDDRNDAFLMAEYKRHKNAKTLLAVCFADREETYHHWKIYSHGSDGVCVIFDKDIILSAFTGDPHIKQGYVEYKQLKEVREMSTVGVEELPFLKRFPYGDESEYRVIYVSDEAGKEFKEYDIKLGSIKQLTLGPWMSEELFASARDMLRSIDGWSNLKITRSTLLENKVWKSLASRVR